MKRRAFLTTAGALAMAGCIGTDEATLSETNETVAIGDSIDISIDQPEWIDNAQAVSAILTNESEDHTAAIELIVQWFDEEGRYIGQDSNSVLALESNSTWYAEIRSTVPFEAEDYNLSATGYRIDHRTVSEIETRTVDVDSDSLILTGEIKNQSNTERSLHVILSAYNNTWLTHSGSVSDSNIPPGTIWRFQTQLNQVAHDESRVGNDLQLTVLDRSPQSDVINETEN